MKFKKKGVDFMENETFCKLLEKHTKSFLRKLKIDNKAKNTILNYGRTYKSFVLFCNEYENELSFENIKEDDIYAFIEYKNDNLQKHTELASSTINSYIIHLRRLFKYIERNSDKLYDFDKVFEDIKPKPIVRVPKGINDNSFDKLVDFLKTIDINKTFTNARNVTLMKLLLFTGVRASEAISISLDNIVGVNNGLYKISFRGKGDKIRTTYIKIDLLEKELNVLKNKYSIDSSKPIALTSTEKNMDRVQLSKMVNSIYKRADIKISGIHILRHTVAKRMIATKVPITVVQSILGHSSIETTSIYSNPTEDIIKREIIKQ